jgi:Tfp pilus assembly protein PilE
MRRATTLFELLLVLAILGILGAMVVPSAARLLDRIEVNGAATELSALFAVARHTAAFRSTRAAVHLDSAHATASITVGLDTVRAVELLHSRGVRLRATRDSVAYGPTGLGFGASTATIIVERGHEAETLYVSRLGRVRR